MWSIHPTYCVNVTAKNLVIRSTGGNGDGIDVDSCKNVRIESCDIDTGDDCIAIKSGRGMEGYRLARPTENVLISNCMLGDSIFACIGIGSETSGGIRNVVVRNCVMDAGNWAPIRFKSQPSRGGVVENIVYRDIKLHDTRQAFEFNMAWRMVQPIAPPAKVLPVVRNVKIINVSGTASSVGMIRGLKDSPIENVRFKNCRIAAQKGFRIENARDVDLSGLSLEVKEGDPVVKVNVQ
jgi:hypothetical protein